MRAAATVLLLGALMPALPALAESPWPQGKTCAVSLTYDDGLASQMDNAVPALNARGLRATFFITGKSDAVAAAPAAWRGLVKQGHEVASHTMRHPCGAPVTPFNPPIDQLEAYNLDRMGKELDATAAFLGGLGGVPPYSFAYPCGQSWVGSPDTSYSPLVKARFVAARGVASGVADPATVDLYDTPGWDLHGASIKDLVAALDQAEAQGGWLIVLFHGVGGDYISVDAQVHAQFLDALAARKEVWTVPFGQAAVAVARARAGRSR